MSTRGAIARLSSAHPVVFTGVYHHWDSYPTRLGKTLWDLYHGHFQQNLEQMLSVLIDQHPAGWSTINGADFHQSPGFNELHGILGEDATDSSESQRPQCYCHGDRAEEPWTVTQQNASGSGCEYVYAFAYSAPAPDIVTAHAFPVETSNSDTANSDAPHGSHGIANGAYSRQQNQQHRHMLVLSSYTVDGEKMIGMFGVGDPKTVWRVIAVLALHGPEPDWERMGR